MLREVTPRTRELTAPWRTVYPKATGMSRATPAGEKKRSLARPPPAAALAKALALGDVREKRHLAGPFDARG